MVFLENKILKLRAIEPEDLDLLYSWENDSEIWTAGNTRVPYSKFQLKEYIAQATHDIYENGFLRLMMTEIQSGKAVGVVDLFDFDIHQGRVGLGLLVSKEHRNRGYAVESLRIVESYVFDFLKINQLYVQIAESNMASRKIFETDYELHGYLKNWIKTPEGFENILTYQKFRRS